MCFADGSLAPTAPDAGTAGPSRALTLTSADGSTVLAHETRAAAPSRMVAIDPRRTPVAAEADLHIQPRLGTNVALLNGIIQQLIAQGFADHAFLEKHTIGFDDLARTVSAYTPDRVADIAHVPAEQIVAAALGKG